MAISSPKKRRGTHTSAKHPDGTYITVSKRKDGRWSGYYYDLDANGNLDRSKRHNLCCRDRDHLISEIIERETPKAVTFAEVALMWQRESWDSYAHQTVTRYKPCLRRLLDEFGNCPIDGIKVADVNAFFQSLGNQGFAARSTSAHKDVMSCVYKCAISHGLVEYSPTDHARIPKGLPKQKRELPPEETLAVIDASFREIGETFDIFPLLCFYTGLRRGEALALRYEDIDRKNCVLHVTKSVEFVGNTPHIKEPKTQNSIRDVQVPVALMSAIPLGIGYIFTDEKTGGLLRQYTFRKKWKQYCAAHNLTITPHQLRHAYASLLYAFGVGVKEAQALLGHSNSQTTLDIYTHLLTQCKTDVAEKVNAMANQRLRDGNFDGKSRENA